MSEKSNMSLLYLLIIPSFVYFPRAIYISLDNSTYNIYVDRVIPNYRNQYIDLVKSVLRCDYNGL